MLAPVIFIYAMHGEKTGKGSTAFHVLANFTIIAAANIKHFIPVLKSDLTLFVPKEFPIKFDTVKSGWSIIYIEGSQVIILRKYCISFSENQFCLSNHSRP